jgi:hypothetical protein
VLVEVLKGVQDESKVKLNSAKICGTQEYVDIEDVIEEDSRTFEEVSF